jgi:hypothetical protein
MAEYSPATSSDTRPTTQEHCLAKRLMLLPSPTGIQEVCIELLTCGFHPTTIVKPFMNYHSHRLIVIFNPSIQPALSPLTLQFQRIPRTVAHPAF